MESHVTLLLMAPFILFFLALFGWMVYRDWLGPQARAWSKAYKLGYLDGLNGTGMHTNPFQSHALNRAYDDGILHARLQLRRREQKQAFKKDQATLGPLRRPC